MGRVVATFCHARHPQFYVRREHRAHVDPSAQSTLCSLTVTNQEASMSMNIAPGHDAWIVGNDPCVCIDVTGAEHYAERK